MDDIAARLRAEVDALAGPDDPAADWAEFQRRVAETAGAPIDLEKYDFGYFNPATGAGNAIIDGEVA